MLLEEAMAGADFPVYGLPKPEYVCGLCYDEDSAPIYGEAVKLKYQSRLYLPFLHEKTRGPTFLVCSRMFESEPGSKRMIVMMKQWSPTLIPEMPPSFWLSMDVSIEGKSFRGHIIYTPKPIYHADFSFDRGRINLEGQSLGPSIDDLIQILQSLRVLNGKAVE